MQEFWNERYSSNEFAYGERPNEYLRAKLKGIQPGKILFPAEGEGRNAVYAATLGWQVSAFDLSEEGKKKAELLAQRHLVQINYQTGEFSLHDYPAESFDAVGLIYAHFPAEKRSEYHQTADRWLKKGGLVILEGFSKKHRQFNEADEKAGGPRDERMLFSLEEIKSDFPNYQIIELCETETILHEGLYHNGKAAVIRFVGRKM
ncbi:SAM-dependent methyltransferase [Parabacteroides sp. FAFU027]|uniref:SAM-dependent methyltransferase n=1 Tax=Parabacteroides sp. FAFU027 TaxID=2922715 RepID=UPI001FAFE690|nr:class I SAM-dependent methyltransferase [Parabacteroides sp. FAFU027]